jgi:hypothetical protein
MPDIIVLLDNARRTLRADRFINEKYFVDPYNKRNENEANDL